MDKIEQLWIRACKSKQPYKRVLTLHRRFYGAYADNELANKVAITGLLVPLVDKYVPMTAFELISKMQHNYFFDQKEECIKTKSFEVVVDQIRRSKVSCFEGLTPRVKFKNKSREERILEGLK